MRSRALGRVPSEVASLAAPRDARRPAMGEAMAAARVRPTRALRATSGLRRPTSRRAARIPSVPGFQFARLPPAPALPRPQSRPPRPPPGRGTENLESWQPGKSANARQDPRFPDSQLADSRSLPATAPAGLPLADAVIALASRPCPNSRCRVHREKHAGRPSGHCGPASRAQPRLGRYTPTPWGRRVTDTPAERGAESTWTRLRRRKVVQWGLVYVASAWAFLQGLEYVSEAFHWPEQLRQVSFLALLIGLPIVLVLALVPRRPRSTTHHDARRPLLCRALRGSGHGPI